MKNTRDDRVLSRLGARELSPEESQHVTGGVVTSILTRFPTLDQNTDG